MKFMCVLLLSILLCGGSLSARKRHQRSEKKLDEWDIEYTNEKDDLDYIAEDDTDEEDGEIAFTDHDDLKRENGGYEEDPCTQHYCGTGRTCATNDKGKPFCDCVTECVVETDERRKVCSNHNETWNSDCELYQMKCWCENSHKTCTKKKYEHVHVEYYGTCKQITKCSDDELADFPRRMREWLFAVMQDLARRDELNDYYTQLERLAEEDLSLKWANSVIWKFCDLDSQPEDRVISRKELFPIRAPLLSMEHCISPFLDSCDTDNDQSITLSEWGFCLGLKDEEIQDKCASVHGSRNKE